LHNINCLEFNSAFFNLRRVAAIWGSQAHQTG
jgi:hypothetical protein